MSAGGLSPIRKLPYLSWHDPDAWMERMEGDRWEKHIHREKNYYNQLLENPEVKKLIPAFEEEMHLVEPMKHLEVFTIGGGVINITLESGGKFKWRWVWDKKEHTAYDIDVLGQTVWYITTDDKSEHYKNYLICETTDCKIIWKKDQVAQQVIVRDGLCYYIKVEDYFRTVELCCCNAYTGQNERILYREKDKKRDLVLIPASYKTLYLKSVDAGKSRCWRITHDRLIDFDNDTETQLLLGRYPDRHHGEDQRIVIKKNDTKYEIRGDYITTWHFPKGTPEYVSLLTGLVIVRNDGELSLWRCVPHTKPQLIFGTPLAYIQPNYWNQWEGDAAEQFVIESPAEPPYSITIMNGRVMAIIQPFAKAPSQVAMKGLHVKKGHAKSEDGTLVPFAIVSNTHTPKGLIVYGYGAYGSPTEPGWLVNKWGPLLRRGWAISYAFVRGGGDKDNEWANSARLTGRMRSIEDFEAVIRKSQEITHLGPGSTVIFGRSAGGLLVGAVAARHPYGELIGAVFTEVPYVDLLRTTTNPDLPLTIGEYNEFGNPLERIQDFATLLKVSPVDQLTCDGAPGIFVLARTGLQDRQVYPYEPFKWIKRLRGSNEAPAGKFITYAKSQAHHYEGPAAPDTRAHDLAILEAWVRQGTKRPAERLSRKTKKNRMYEYKKKMARNNKSNKNNMMGGKRRKTARKGKKAARKTRRANRK